MFVPDILFSSPSLDSGEELILFLFFFAFFFSSFFPSSKLRILSPSISSLKIHIFTKNINYWQNLNAKTENELAHYFVGPCMALVIPECQGFVLRLMLPFDWLYLQYFIKNTTFKKLFSLHPPGLSSDGDLHLQEKTGGKP